ncbi:hypothetical protein DFH11DRAFT_1814477 [Phellopilus nigrolimitatus]|nr:hypothetical protein DFH11DRAFT_1814477 [Phellopilus nigrolimitatus]
MWDPTHVTGEPGEIYCPSSSPGYPIAQQLAGAAPTNVRREASPSPSLRERQRFQPQPQTQTQLPALCYPRPIARVAPPQFLSYGNEKWQIPDDFHPDGTRADCDLQQHQTMQPAEPGTEGLVYAGGAVSATYGRMKTAAAVAAAAGAAAFAGVEANVDSSGGRRRTSGELQTQHLRAVATCTPDRSLPVQEELDEHEQQQQQQAAPLYEILSCRAGKQSKDQAAASSSGAWPTRSVGAEPTVGVQSGTK